MKHIISIILCFIFALYASEPVDELEALMEMSFEELLNQTIVVASKKAEPVSDASGTVTVYSRKAMDAMGIYTLKDLAEVTPGYSLNVTSDNDAWLETRGTYGTHNSKHLILVDGISINHSRNYMGQVDWDLPLHFAERVEFLKGPASALYGTGAFNGVINIVSSPKEQARVLVNIGTENFKKNNDDNYIMNKSLLASLTKKGTYGVTHLSIGYHTKDADQQPTSKNYLDELNKTIETSNQTGHYTIDNQQTYTAIDSSGSFTLLNSDTLQASAVTIDSSFSFSSTGSLPHDTITVQGYPVYSKQDLIDQSIILDNYSFVDTLNSNDIPHYVIKDSLVNKQVARYLTAIDTNNRIFPEQYGATQNEMRTQETSLFIHVSQLFTEGLFKGFKIGLIYTDRENGYGMGWADNSSISNLHIWSSLIPYLSYSKDLSPSLHLYSSIKYNKSREFGKQANRVGWWAESGSSDAIMNGTALPRWGLFEYDVFTHNIEGTSEISYSNNKDFTIIAGLQYDTRWQDQQRSYTIHSNALATNGFNGGHTQLYGEKAHTWSEYIQISYTLPLLKGLITTTGVRQDNGYLDGETYSTLSPRLALVQKITDQINIRSSYSRALKAPGIQEVSHNNEKSYQIENHNTQYPDKQNLTHLKTVKPEIIETLEGGITYNRSKFSASYTHFYNMTTQTIGKFFFWKKHGAIGNGGVIDGSILESDFFGNYDGTTYAQGGELEFQVTPCKRYYIVANGSFAETWGFPNPDTPDNKTGYTPYAPIWTGNIGLSYTANVFNFFTWIKYISGYREFQTIKNGHYTVDFNSRLNLASYADLTLKVTNLLNNKYKTAVGAYYLPERTITVGVDTQF
ncbi:MAG: TonB-dependent receptor [Fibrobacterales bacterium]